MYVIRFVENGIVGPYVGGPIGTLAIAIKHLEAMKALIAESNIVDGTRVVFTRGGTEFGFEICEWLFGQGIKTIEVEEK